jgi:hypothetical protein
MPRKPVRVGLVHLLCPRLVTLTHQPGRRIKERAA